MNSSVENIGARRLQTVMERVLDEISFAAPDRSGETVKIDAAYVQQAHRRSRQERGFEPVYSLGWLSRWLAPSPNRDLASSSKRLDFETAKNGRTQNPSSPDERGGPHFASAPFATSTQGVFRPKPAPLS